MKIPNETLPLLTRLHNYPLMSVEQATKMGGLLLVESIVEIQRLECELSDLKSQQQSRDLEMFNTAAKSDEIIPRKS